MKIKYEIIGLECPNCAAKVEKMVGEATGLIVKLNFLTETLTLDADEDTPALEATVRATVAAFSPDLTLNRMA